jgi:hypothetical protein
MSLVAAALRPVLASEVGQSELAAVVQSVGAAFAR